VTVYYFLYKIENSNNKIILQSYNNNIKSLLIGDINNALELNISQKSFSFFNTVSLKQHNQDCRICDDLKPCTIIKENVIIIYNNSQELKLDIHDFREHIAQIVPSFITYRILLNQHNIASSYQKKPNFDITEEIFHQNLNIILSFGIDRESEYYQSSLKKILINCLNSLFITFIIISFVLFLYFIIKSKIKSKITYLENIITQYEEENTNLIKHNKIKQKLEEKFIKKITTLYVSQQCGNNMYKQQDIIKSYLFPVTITDLVTDELDVREFIKYIEEYFVCSNTNIYFEITNNIKKIEIHCAQEVFYQILISLIHNIIAILEDQSSISRKVIIALTNRTVSICYDGFPLTEQGILELSNTVLSNKLNVFLLDSNKIFKSLKAHDITYNIFYENNFNTICITFNNKNQSGKIIEFTKNNGKVVV